MSEAGDLAAKIDAMTLDELGEVATGGKLPKAGVDPEYDTKGGWARRMHMDIRSKKFIAIWDMLLKERLITLERGYVDREGHWYTKTLYHSPTLAKKCGQ